MGRREVRKTVPCTLGPGSVVKIVRRGEAFWNRIVSIRGADWALGEVLNDCVVNGYVIGDPITFILDDIVDVIDSSRIDGGWWDDPQHSWVA
jgi:hypothetical protein